MRFFINIFLLFIAISIFTAPLLAETKGKKSTKKEIEPERVQYVANDKFKIVADLYLPQKLKKNVRIPLVIFLHDLSENKKVFGPYAKELVAKGYSVFVPDLRGHGESIINKKGKKQYWRSLTDANWKYLGSDVTNGIDTLRKDFPQVNVNKTVIIGSSLGAVAAVIAAEKENSSVKSLVLLSPYTNYRGNEIRVAMVNYGVHPVLFAVSKKDIASYKATIELVKYTQGEHSVALLKNAGHGTFMIKFEPKLKNIIYNWLAKKLPPVEEANPVPASKTTKKSNSH